ncbi:hypothetical protein MUK42_32154 [Musa troglodytarum]|uniref:Uncharacterized protein n=1 Tax=Musa troglodytarum TaxID=320322 RepID=A0A9E7LB71_9LILI|nr:hypothetical protein MUK42_32154 [Musa troglodytarum]
MVNLCFSSMSSSSSPSGSLQSKECTKAPNMYCTNTMPVSFPEQILLPAPKGMNSKSLPWGRTWLLAAGDEAVGVEHQRVRPHLRVPPDGPDVDEEATVAGDAVVVHLALLVGEVRQAERGGRVQTQRFLAHRLQVCQLGQVRLFQQAVSPHHRVCLRLRSLQDSRVPQHLRHGPLHVRPPLSFLLRRLVLLEQLRQHGVEPHVDAPHLRLYPLEVHPRDGGEEVADVELRPAREHVEHNVLELVGLLPWVSNTLLLTRTMPRMFASAHTSTSDSTTGSPFVARPCMERIIRPNSSRRTAAQPAKAFPPSMWRLHTLRRSFHVGL